MSALSIIGTIVIVIYCISLAYITVYCLMQFHLLSHYRKHHKTKPDCDGKMIPNRGESYPFVTIQLPIYNELYVVERLIDTVAALHYPKDRMEIHVLDDSTDETVDMVKRKVEEHRAKGVNIRQIKRDIRQGYKAGALRDAMKYVKGEFIAIFDADFLPKSNFLLKTLSHFVDEKVGVVQTRWGHLNHDYSLLTEIQALQLNVHFTVEQLGRSAGDYLLQFNGTAGLWRKSCIEDAGGWEADTLTEDLDLSYRAQLKGWKITYLENIISPAELPAEMNGLKSQQYRWMKGGAETAMKVLPQVWKSNIGLGKKIFATAHLLSSSVFLFVFIVGVFSVPLAFLINPMNFNKDYLIIFLFGLLSIGIVYYVANVQMSWEGKSRWRMVLKFLYLFPIFLALSMGLSLHNAVAVLQGLRGKKSAFVRTPKFDIGRLSKSRAWRRACRQTGPADFRNKKYFNGKINKITIMEGLLSVYFAFGLGYGIYTSDTAFTLMHFALAFGYGTIFYYSIRHLSLKS